MKSSFQYQIYLVDCINKIIKLKFKIPRNEIINSNDNLFNNKKCSRKNKLFQELDSSTQLIQWIERQKSIIVLSPYALTDGALLDLHSALPGSHIAGMDILYPYE